MRGVVIALALSTVCWSAIYALATIARHDWTPHTAAAVRP